MRGIRTVGVAVLGDVAVVAGSRRSGTRTDETTPELWTGMPEG